MKKHTERPSPCTPLPMVGTHLEGVWVVRNNAHPFIQQTHIACFVCMPMVSHVEKDPVMWTNSTMQCGVRESF